MSQLMRLYCAFICFVLSARIAAQHHYAPPVAEAEVPNGTDSAMPLIAPRMTPPDVIRLACHGRTPCNAIHRFVAGHDAAGNSLEIFIIDLWDGTSEREGWGGASRPFKLLEDLQNCRAENAVEYWLFASKNRQIVKHQLIHVGCDGSGFGDLGEEGISFGDNGFSYHSHGGHGYNQGNSEAHGSLSPALILGSGWDAGPCDISGSDWDWRKFSGSGWRDPDGCGDGTGELRWSLIPRVSLPADYLSARWKTVSPGDCASREAFALKDDPPPNEQLLRVVLADSGDLFIEVHDDRLIDNPKRWIFGDHVELWLGTSHMEKDKDDTLRRVGSLQQWGISALTGKVFPGFGKPSPLHAEVVRTAAPSGGRVVRMKIKLPEKFEGITVVYSDTEDGKSQTRMIATSRLKFAKHDSLGEIQVIKSTEAVCEIRGDRLAPIVHLDEPSDPDRPLIGTADDD